MNRFFGNCFQRRRGEAGGSQSRNTEYRQGQTRSTSSSGSEENPSVETEGPWRAFTRFISNSWNQRNQPRQYQRRRESAHWGTTESPRTFNWGNWGFTFHSSVQSTWPPPVWGNMEANTEHGNVPSGDQERPLSGAPPASDDAISRLPELTFQEADLVADGDKNCPICLEQHRVGGKGVRLPCGHCFHAPCIKPWLKKHCMCPVCRFEIPTSDSNYEWSRKRRMKRRKRRIRLSELEGYSIRQLRGLATEMSIDLSTAIEKCDVVKAISLSHQVEIVPEAAEPRRGMKNKPSYPASHGDNSQCGQTASRSLEDLSIGELLSLMKVHELSARGCTEKYDLVRVIRDVGIN